MRRTVVGCISGHSTMCLVKMQTRCSIRSFMCCYAGCLAVLGQVTMRSPQAFHRTCLRLARPEATTSPIFALFFSCCRRLCRPLKPFVRPQHRNTCGGEAGRHTRCSNAPPRTSVAVAAASSTDSHKHSPFGGDCCVGRLPCATDQWPIRFLTH